MHQYHRNDDIGIFLNIVPVINIVQVVLCCVITSFYLLTLSSQNLHVINV